MLVKIKISAYGIGYHGVLEIHDCVFSWEQQVISQTKCEIILFMSGDSNVSVLEGKGELLARLDYHNKQS